MCQASKLLLRVVTIRDTALRDSRASCSSGAKAPRTGRVFAPAKYVASTVVLISPSRR